MARTKVFGRYASVDTLFWSSLLSIITHVIREGEIWRSYYDIAEDSGLLEHYAVSISKK
jgi:hypothetical protein